MGNSIKVISELFAQNSSDVFCELNKFYFNSTAFISSIESNLNSNGVQFDKQPEKVLIKVRSFLDNINIVPFSSIEKFFDEKLINESYLILNTNGNYLYHDNKRIFWSEKVIEQFKIKCLNFISYYKLFNLLKKENFSDHHNDANTELIFYSSAKGIFKIKYETEPEIIGTEEITRQVEQLLELVESIQFKPFLKNALFNFSKDKCSISILEIIQEAKGISETTKRDYELASKLFDFDKFRDSLYKEKEKYFNGIREIVNKIFSQAIGIPISISATVFATYKIDDEPIILGIVLISFILYVILYVRLQITYKSDLKEIKKDFETDFKIIEEKSGLPKDIIKREETKVKKKLDNSISIVNWIVGTVIILGVLLAIYILYQIDYSEIIKIICPKNNNTSR